MAASISNLPRSNEELLLEALRFTFDQHGADPSDAFEALAIAVENQVWVARGLTFVEFLRAPYPTGVGIDPDTLQKLLQVPHRHEAKDQATREWMKRLRGEFLRLTCEPLATHGTNQHGRGLRITKSSTETKDDAEYALSRLRRDRPELAELVIAGEMTANQAAIQAGFRRKKVSIYADPQGIARWARKHFTAEQIAELVEALQ